MAADTSRLTLLGLLLAYRWVFVISVAITCALAIVYLVNATPIYRAATMAVPAEWDNTLGANAGLLGTVRGLTGLGSLGARDRTAEYLAIIESRSFLEQFIGENDLLPVLFAGEDSEEPPTLWRGYRRLAGIVRVDQDAATQIVTVAVLWKDPQLAATWANQLVDLLNRVARERASREAEANLEYLNKELAATQVAEVRTSMFSLIENEIRNQMLAKVREDYALRVVDAALPPDTRDVHSPNTLQVLLLAIMVGTFFAAVIVFLVADARQHA